MQPKTKALLVVLTALTGFTILFSVDSYTAIKATEIQNRQINDYKLLVKNLGQVFSKLERINASVQDGQKTLKKMAEFHFNVTQDRLEETLNKTQKVIDQAMERITQTLAQDNQDLRVTIIEVTEMMKTELERELNDTQRILKTSFNNVNVTIDTVSSSLQQKISSIKTNKCTFSIFRC